MSFKPIIAFLAAALPCGLFASTASAQDFVLAEWDFGDPVHYPRPDDQPKPSFGDATASAKVIGMQPSTDFEEDTDGLRAWRVRGENGWDEHAAPGQQGIQVMVDTSAAEGALVLEMSWWATKNAVKHGQLWLTVDGGKQWTLFGEPQVAGGVDHFSDGSESWYELRWQFQDLPEASGNPEFGFRFVSAYAPVEFVDSQGHSAEANSAYMKARYEQQDDITPYHGEDGNWRIQRIRLSSPR
ncbi:MAG: hypothetical protein ACFCU3_00670 [Verrucomicrobiales bacterium]